MVPLSRPLRLNAGNDSSLLAVRSFGRPVLRMIVTVFSLGGQAYGGLWSLTVRDGSLSLVKLV